MKSETVQVKSRDHGDFEYQLNVYETIEEAVKALGATKALDFLNRGHKAAAGSAEWAKRKIPVETETVEIGGQQHRMSKSAAAAVKAMLEAQTKAAMAKKPAA